MIKAPKYKAFSEKNEVTRLFEDILEGIADPRAEIVRKNRKKYGTMMNNL